MVYLRFKIVMNNICATHICYDVAGNSFYSFVGIIRGYFAYDIIALLFTIKAVLWYCFHFISYVKPLSISLYKNNKIPVRKLIVFRCVEIVGAITICPIYIFA